MRRAILTIQLEDDPALADSQLHDIVEAVNDIAYVSDVNVEPAQQQ